MRIKLDFLLLLCFLSPLICCGYVMISSENPIPRPKHCSGGQGYWCKNITTAVECRAFKHCVKSVWEHEVPIEKDTSTVCETCIEMVKEARDQLESNETQSEIRQVLEASCKVIPVRALRKDCEKLMDDFGSYLVDTLASEMDPQVVCSVAGLCNNAALKEAKKPELNCDSCYGLMSLIEEKIETASNDDFQAALVGVCGNFGSYSDSCANLMLSHFSEIASVISENVKAAPVCSLAGVCTEKFHSHADLPRESIAGADDLDVEVIANMDGGDDLPCDLCEQLVKHLKEVLIANTTEAEFKMVLTGICQQMSAYKDECLHFVGSYYDVVYNFLVNELDGKLLCTQIGICPVSDGSSAVVRPLIFSPEPIEPLPTYQRPLIVLDPMTIIPQSMLGSSRPQSQMVCSFCEYLLHFVQQEITLPSNEKRIREVVERACSRLPTSVSEQCTSFVETYAAAFIALLANRIDPSQVCPGIGVCPGSLAVVEYKDKPTCPLCLLAMEEVLRKVNNKTEADINDALDDLCIRDVFPNSLTTECATFITSYREPLTDMIVADFTPEEACLYSQICSLPTSMGSSRKTTPKKEEPVGSIDTNEIRDNSNEDKESSNSNSCVLCEFVMTKLEKILKDKTTEEEIKESVYKICNYMPHTVTAQCKEFVQEYADLVIELLTNEISPKEVCQAINLCDKASQLIRGPLRKCLTCEVLMDVMRTIVTDPDVDMEFNEKLTTACQRLPKRSEISTCMEIVEQLAPQIEAAFRTLPVGPLICRRIGVCGSPQCSLGPSFWCSSEENALMCQEREFCQQQVWNKNKHLVSHSKHSSHLKGMDVI